MFYLDTRRGFIKKNNKTAEYTGKELKLLNFLKDNNLHTDIEILTELYGEEAKFYDIGVLRTIISRFRKKTGIKIIRRRGLGYMLTEKCKEI